MTRTIAFRRFTTPLQLATAISALMAEAVAEGVDPEDVNIDAEVDVFRLVENTLTDGSKVYNLEID